MRKRLLGCLIAMVLLPMQGFASISNAELEDFELAPVSYTHLTLPTTPYV